MGTTNKDKREKVPLDDWEKDRVKEYAKKDEVSKAEWMRTAIRKEIERVSSRSK